MLELAQDYYSVNRPDLALGLTQKVIAGGLKSAQAYYIDGISQIAVGHQKESIADLETAATIDPTNSAVLDTLTNLYLRANRPADAERVAKRAVTFNKDNKDAYLTLGQVYNAQKKYDDARAQYELAAKIDPKDPHPLVLEGQSYADQNAIALASQMFDRAIALDPTSQEALINKARTAALEHNVKDAIAAYQTLLTLQTTDADKAAVIDDEAHTYAVEKMDAEADQLYRQAIASYPKVSSTHLTYGDYLAFKNDIPGALREWTSAVGPNRDNPEALSRLGDYYAQKNDITNATANYKRLTEIAQQDPRAWLSLANASLAAKNFTQARDAFRNSYALSHSPEALVGLAQSDYLSKNYKECLTIYTALDKNAPGFIKQNPQILYFLGQCSQNTGNLKNARGFYARFLQVLKPGSQAAKQTKDLIAKIDASEKKKPIPKATAKPKH